MYLDNILCVLIGFVISVVIEKYRSYKACANIIELLERHKDILEDDDDEC